MSDVSAFEKGEWTLKVYLVVLGIGILWALYAVFNTDKLLVWMEIPEDLESSMTYVIRYTQTFFLAWWTMELAHVALTLDTRRTLKAMESAAQGTSRAEDFRRGDWILFMHQVVLAVGMFGGLILMMVTPGVLKKAGVEMAVGSAVTLLVWCAYIGPTIFCAFRFHHVGITRHTRREMAEREDALSNSV